MALANAVPQFEARTLLVAAFLITGLALTATVWQDREVPILLPVAVALAVILYVSDRLSVPTVREDSAALGGSHYPECPPSPIPQPRGKTPI